MFSLLQRKNLFHVIISMKMFCILVLTSLTNYRIYDYAYLKKFCITSTPSQIIPNHTSVGKLLNDTVYHTEMVMEKKKI